MKPILILCGVPAKSAELPLWLEKARPKKFDSPESFLEEGLEHLTERAALVLLGPKTLQAVRTLRRFPQTALLPIAAPGGAQIPGVDADPKDEESLRESCKKIHEAISGFDAIDDKGDLGDASVLLFLRFLISRGEVGIAAKPDLLSPFGYSYPLCGIFFNDALESWPNDLVRLNLLGKRFHDLIHVCPDCSRYNLNYREICPECASANIGVGEVLHHFRCGEVGAEANFRRGEELICPKCNHLLRHLGVDYDRPTEFYHCRNCPAVFSEPLNDAFCLSCSRSHKLGALREHPVSNFVLTEEARRAVREGLFPSGAVQAMFDRELGGGLYSPEFFQEFAKIEIKRRKRYGRTLSVLGLLVDFPEGREISIKRVHQMVWTVARTMRENLRDSDLLARCTDRLYLSLLTDTPTENSAIVVDRLEKKANEAVEKFGGRFVIREVTASYLRLAEKGPVDFQEIVREMSQPRQAASGEEPQP